MTELKIPVERLQVDDKVRAVENGPAGYVTRHINSWVIVDYGKIKLPYKHGDSLYLVKD